MATENLGPAGVVATNTGVEIARDGKFVVLRRCSDDRAEFAVKLVFHVVAMVGAYMLIKVLCCEVDTAMQSTIILSLMPVWQMPSCRASDVLMAKPTSDSRRSSGGVPIQ